MDCQRDQQLKKWGMVGLDSYLITKNENLGGISSGFFMKNWKKLGEAELDSYLIMKNKNLGGLSSGFFLDEQLKKLGEIELDWILSWYKFFTKKESIWLST